MDLTIFEDSYQGFKDGFHRIKFVWGERVYVAYLDEDEDDFEIVKIETEKGKNLPLPNNLFTDDDLYYLESFAFAELLEAAKMTTPHIRKIVLDELRTNPDGSKTAVIKVGVGETGLYWLHYKKNGPKKHWKYDGGLVGFRPEIEIEISKIVLDSYRKYLNQLTTAN